MTFPAENDSPSRNVNVTVAKRKTYEWSGDERNDTHTQGLSTCQTFPKLLSFKWIFFSLSPVSYSDDPLLELHFRASLFRWMGVLGGDNNILHFKRGGIWLLFLVSLLRALPSTYVIFRQWAPTAPWIGLTSIVAPFWGCARHIIPCPDRKWTLEMQWLLSSPLLFLFFYGIFISYLFDFCTALRYMTKLPTFT